MNFLAWKAKDLVKDLLSAAISVNKKKIGLVTIGLIIMAAYKQPNQNKFIEAGGANCI
jgi:hypothetical protein